MEATESPANARQCVAWSWRDWIIRKQRPGCGLKAAMRSPGSGIRSTAPEGTPNCYVKRPKLEKSGRRESNPTFSAWKADVLPLNYARLIEGRRRHAQNTAQNTAPQWACSQIGPSRK